MRDPSLHITKKNLAKILNILEFNVRTSGEELSEKIFYVAGPFQIKDRYLKLLNTKTPLKKKLEKSLKADAGMPDKFVELFNGLLTSCRQAQNSFTKVRLITKDNKDYILLKEVAKIAHEFSEHFDIQPRKDGYLEFIKLGLAMMPKYGLNKFKYYQNKIFDSFDNQLQVVTDTNRQATLEFYNIWQAKMVEYSGLEDFVDIEYQYDKFIHILLGRQASDVVQADYELWIVAQFEGLAFLSAIPELSQFYGDGALNRYERHLKATIEYAEEDEKTKDLKGYYD